VASGGSRGGQEVLALICHFSWEAGGGRPGEKRGKFAVENAKPSSDNPDTVRDIDPHLDDLHFVQECLEGKSSALSYFQEHYRPKLQAFLKSQGASLDEATEIVENLWSECVAPTATARPKLERYQGGCALQSWLNTIALNSLLSKRRRDVRWGRLVESVDAKPKDGEGRIDDEPGTTVDPEPEREPLLALMRSAIDTAFRECPPEDFVLLQLAHCDQLKVKELALMFRCDISTISRRLHSASEHIGRVVLRSIGEADSQLDLKWDDFMELCRSTSAWSFYEA
jgi:RNA polymerase sigma factor (sigma-70 family)